MGKRPTTKVNKNAHLMSQHGNMNPLDQELILKLVLSHVGVVAENETVHEVDYAAAKAIATNDLKNCRLVSHAWNRIAVKVLEKRFAEAMYLNSEERIKEFKSILWKTRRCSANNGTGLGLRLVSLQIRVSVKKFDDISEIAQLLLQNPHLRVCEIFLNFRYGKQQQQPPALEPIPSPSLNQDLLTLFRHSSPTVQCITCANNAQAAPPSQEFDFDACYSELEFPKLCYISYHHVKFFQNGMLVDFTRHVVSIMKCAPKLTNLRLSLCDGEDTEAAASAGAAGLQLRLMLQTCAPTLRRFALFGSLDENSNGRMLKIGLAKVIFPILEFLELKYADQYLKNGLSEFVVNNCPRLISTTVTWSSLRIMMNEHGECAEVEVRIYGQRSTKLSFYQDLFYAPFPGLLDHLHQMLLLAAKFYSSTPSMKFYLELLSMLAEHLQERLEEEDQQPPPPPLPLLLATHYPILGNITTLKVRINSYQGNNRFKANLSELATQLYHHVFPNLKTLVIKPNWLGSYYSTTTCKHRILRAIRFLCNHPGIQNLEIKNFASNSWLQQIGAESGDDELSFFADGLKTLKLQLKDRTSSKGPPPPRVKLMSILSQFPSLEFLQFEKKIVSRDEIKVVRAAMSTVNKFDNY